MLLNAILDNNKSTSVLLESINGKQLKVVVDSQYEKKVNNKYIIERYSRLYFFDSLFPVIYSKCYIEKNQLFHIEYIQLISGKIPIGIIFSKNDINYNILKNNIKIAKIKDTIIAKLINSKHETCYKKEYDFNIDDRKIGHIIEYFNKESLTRI